MRIPSAIDQNTLKAYEPRARIISSCSQTLQSYNFESWDKEIPKTLQELCVESIAKNWAENPVLNEIVLPIDRYLLLDILETDLPLKLTIPKIPDDVYWKRCYLEKWPRQQPVNVRPIEISEIFRGDGSRRLSSTFSVNGSNGSTGGRNSMSGSQSSQLSQEPRKIVGNTKNIDYDKRTWKEYYIEMYLKEYLENMKPEEYDAEKMKELSDICSSYVKVLRIEQMRCSENSSNRMPLNSILSGFQHLKELSICFKQTYVGEQFSWNVLNTAFQDIKLLARGLEKLRLHVLRIRNSDMNCEKLIMILKALLKHDIRTLDFCHCKIADKGTLAVSKFILEVSVKELILANNRLGSKGIEYLSYALRQPTCVMTKLDLHLNQLNDQAGNLLFGALCQKTMKSLLLSGCGFGETLSIGHLLKTNSSLEFLDISNNHLGEDVGQAILAGLKYNFTIKKMDLRMCKISTETEFEIQELINAKRKGKVSPLTEEIHDHLEEEICDENLIAEFETVLINYTT